MQFHDRNVIGTDAGCLVHLLRGSLGHVEADDLHHRAILERGR